MSEFVGAISVGYEGVGLRRALEERRGIGCRVELLPVIRRLPLEERIAGK